MNKNNFYPKLILSCALLPVGLIYVNAVCVKATLGRRVVGTNVVISDSRPNLRTDILEKNLLKLLRGNNEDKFIYRNTAGKLEVRLNRIERCKSVGLVIKSGSEIYIYNDENGVYEGASMMYTTNYKISDKFIIKHIENSTSIGDKTIFVPKDDIVEVFTKNITMYDKILDPEDENKTIQSKFVVHFHDDEGKLTDSVFKITHENKMVRDVEASSSQIAKKTIEEFKNNNGDIYLSYFEESKEDGSMVTRKWYPKNSSHSSGYELTEVRTDAYGNISGASYGVNGQLMKSIPPSFNVTGLDFNKLQSVLTHEERR